MSPPHPDAIGSYGRDFEKWWIKNAWDPRYPAPRYWQRLAARRILEYRADGSLCWPEWLLTMARQLGKSVILQGLALWRLDVNPDHFDEVATVVHTANKISVSREIQTPARTYAKALRSEGWKSRDQAGQESITHPNGGLWRCAAIGSVYGFTASLGLVDEAWAIPDADVTNGLEPTMLARSSPQLGLLSTAHPRATSLFVDRRRVAREPGASSLLIEWSAPHHLRDEDREGWRMASPHWDPQREGFIARKLAAARAPKTLAPDELDPMDVWRTQYLNRWSDRSSDDIGLAGERFSPDGAWDLGREGAETTGAPIFAIEDHAGLMFAVAAAMHTSDGRISVEAYTVKTRADAYAWVAGNTHPGSSLFVGRALAEAGGTADLEELLPVEVCGPVETAQALSLVRHLISLRELVHPAGCIELEGQAEVCRVVQGASGLRITSTMQRSDLLRAASWCVAAVERERRFEPTVW